MARRKPRRTHDPRVLRAIAHPLRSRILDELRAAGPLRAADVAKMLEIPANQASFHLRQLAKYGLVEPAPELARDGRDRVWRGVSSELHLDEDELEASPGGKAAMTVFMRNKASWAHLLVDRAFAPKKKTKGTFYAVVEESFRFTKDDGDEFMSDLSDLLDRWTQKTRGRDGDRKTYEFFALVQPYPEQRPDA
ncbi:MAG TPA: helix-turn-helix domain-containing protein [Nocardioides sp.]|uniref:ArsR/SmtB family transcription factor n=1 Tax=Nocardioides sp. TaxID=35761 RepID=UPI002F3E5C84